MDTVNTFIKNVPDLTLAHVAACGYHVLGTTCNFGTVQMLFI